MDFWSVIRVNGIPVLSPPGITLLSPGGMVRFGVQIAAELREDGGAEVVADIFDVW
jgi:hypothetical protein